MLISFPLTVKGARLFIIRSLLASSQSPNHSLNAGVLTCNHCFSVKLVGRPLGAFINVPSEIARSFISANSSLGTASYSRNALRLSSPLGDRGVPFTISAIVMFTKSSSVTLSISSLLQSVIVSFSQCHVSLSHCLISWISLSALAISPVSPVSFASCCIRANTSAPFFPVSLAFTSLATWLSSFKCE